MSLLIKDIYLPQNETYLDLVITADGNVCCYDHEGVSVAKAVELPDHGDLIDRDALMFDTEERYCTGCDSYRGLRCRACWVDDMHGELVDAPVVIPAERSGDV